MATIGIKLLSVLLPICNRRTLLVDKAEVGVFVFAEVGVFVFDEVPFVEEHQI